MINNLRYKFARIMGKTGAKVVSLKGGMGKSFPGWLFLKFGSYEALNNLAQEPEIGSVIYSQKIHKLVLILKVTLLMQLQLVF